jgi:hydrogenase small subunit
VHYLTFKELPATDTLGRPLFAHGDRIHDDCPRRAHYDAGQFVQEWGDEGHRQGWCLYKMGCKGPATDYNCPRIQWNDGTNWPIGVGHGCVGCAQPGFWDTMTPFYQTLPNVGGFGVEATAEEVGLAVIGTVAALTTVHAVGSVVRNQRAKKRERDLSGTREEPPEAPNLAATNEATRKWPTEPTEE